MRRLPGGEDEQRAVTGVVSHRGQGSGRTAWRVPVGPALHPAMEWWLPVPRRLFFSGARRWPGVCPNGTGGSSPLGGREYEQIFREQQVNEENKT